MPNVHAANLLPRWIDTPERPALAWNRSAFPRLRRISDKEMRWSHDRLSLRFSSQLSSRRQLLLRKAARAQAILQRVSASHSAPRDLEYEEAVGHSSPGQQRTPRAETSTSRPPKEIRCRRQTCFRGTRAATADNSAEDLQIVHLHPGVAHNAT